MTMLTDEIAEIQRHTHENGMLKPRGKAGYALNETRIMQLAGLLRG